MKKREWDPNPGGYSLGKLTALAIALPVSGIALLRDGQVRNGVLVLLCALAAIIAAYFWWTRPKQ